MKTIELKSWNVYIVECADGTLYTGVTTNLTRRIREHNSSDNKGARYTRSRQPVSLVYSEQVENRKVACQREAQIKAFTRQKKLALIANNYFLY